MKKALIFVLALSMLMFGATTALASGWHAITSSTPSPHGNYSDGSDKCETCHAVHEADGSTYKLLKGASSANTACDFCHGLTGFANSQGFVLATDTKGHGAMSTSIFDSNGTGTDYTISGGLVCTSCHTVHGNGAVANAAGYKILKNKPYGSVTVDYSPTAAYGDMAWCADCHTNNDITAHNSTSHVMTDSVNATLANAHSDRCMDCHAAGAADKYPHDTTADNLLKSGATTNLDDVCNDCHPNAGSTF